MSTGRTVIVVHGHRHRRGGREHARISAECVARLSVAEQMAVEHRLEDVLLSGSGEPESASEAEQMAELWSGPAIRLWLDEASDDSAENATAAIRWAHQLGATELIVVSSWWHLRLPIYYRRARREGIKVRFRGCRRMNGVASHLLHELRYLPRALRLASRPNKRPWRVGLPNDEERVATRLLTLQEGAERNLLEAEAQGPRAA